MENQVSVKRIIIDFIYIREQLKELFKDRKEYELIIDFLLKKDYLNDELDIPFPKLKVNSIPDIAHLLSCKIRSSFI